MTFRIWISSRLLQGMLVGTLSVCAGCSTSPPADQAGGLSTLGDRADPGPSEVPDDFEQRPFRPLESDQPGGPVHHRSIPAEPPLSFVTTVATAPATRRSAEVFAIVMYHAIRDQTARSAFEGLGGLFDPDLPASVTAGIARIRSFPGSRMVPGGRGWVRSRFSGAGSVAEADVYVVEKIENPVLGESPSRPYVYWEGMMITLTRTVGRWQLSDLRGGGGSEYPTFNEFAWESVMDSGRDWRRFDVE